MRIIVASDIHGSSVFCRKLLRAYDLSRADKLILLGDILYHGPRNGLSEGYDPKLTADLLNAYAKNIICIKGNCDSEVDQMVLDFPIMSDTAMICLEGITALLVHGHKSADNQPLGGVNIVFSGHTHVPSKVLNGGILYANPGSVSIPKENSPRSYILWEQNRLSWYTLEDTSYDFAVI